MKKYIFTLFDIFYLGDNIYLEIAAIIIDIDKF